MKDYYIAQTIWEQLGANKFQVMTGAKIIAMTENSLTVSFGRNRTNTNRLRITLNGLDYYDLEFIRATKQRVGGVLVGEKEKVDTRIQNVSCDRLQFEFTDFTGLYTHL
jgi:hypothetical protein